MNLLFNVTIYDISVIYVTAHRCAGGTIESEKKIVTLIKSDVLDYDELSVIAKT